MSYSNDQRSWYKNTFNKRISGVCSGLVQRLDLPVWSTRLVTFLVFLSFPFVVGLGYLIAHCCLEEKQHKEY